MGTTVRNSGYNALIFGVNVNSGAVTIPIVYYGGANNFLQMSVLNAAMDPNGNIILVGSFSSYPIPSVINSTGSLLPALPIVGETDGWMAYFDLNGNLHWQASVGSPYYDSIWTVTTDVTGAVYIGGSVSGSVNGGTYSSNNGVGVPEPFFQKMDMFGDFLWINILPKYDFNQITRLVTDNIGALYLAGDSVNDYPYTTPVVLFSGFNAYSVSTGSQSIYLMKSDTNGALQWSVAGGSTGIVQHMTIDNTGLLVLSGSFYGGNSLNLHGLYPTDNNVWNGFLDTQLLSYNCSCNNLAALVQQMSTLLNITAG